MLMLNADKLPKSLERKLASHTHVVVHPISRDMSKWVVGTYDGRGKYTAMIGDGTTYEEALRAAAKHRRHVNKLHLKNIMK